MEIEFNIGRLLVYYISWTIDQGRMPSGDAAMSKLFCNQYEQRLTNLATTIYGPLEPNNRSGGALGADER